MPYYSTYPRCGDSLDPGERCEFQREEQQQPRKTELHPIKTERSQTTWNSRTAQA